MQEALFYEQKPDSQVSCSLCNHHCLIAPDGVGICGVRKNVAGRLYSLNYGKVVAASCDPIEKKPLFHFLPGSLAYSLAGRGCNFQCDFCQNWQISQAAEAGKLGVPEADLTPAAAVAQAIARSCQSISYTYTEPTVFFEFAYDCARLAKEKGLRNNFVTNGYMSKYALRHISPYLDAANVDLKSFREEFYRRRCKASLSPVLENISLMKELGIWVEVTTLVIPGENDSPGELSQIAAFIAGLDKDMPWHISRYHPDYKFSGQATSRDTLQEAYQIGRQKGLNHVYLGNIYTDYGETTYCPACAKALIEREGFVVCANHIQEGRCGFCQAVIKGVWK